MIPSVLLTILIIFISFLGESTFGFGGGFISIPLLSILLGVKTAIIFVLLFQFCMGFMLFSTRKHTNWKIALPITVSITIGTLLGSYMLSFVSSFFLQKFLAITIFVFLIKMYFFPTITFKDKHTKIVGFFTGLIGGWFQGITGTSSPIFTMYLTSLSFTKTTMRATLIYIFFATSVIRVLVSFSEHLITPFILSLALPTFPFFVLAIYLGHHAHKKLNDKYYRYIVYIVLFLSAITLLLKK
ncbi:MAG TPA: sulfite exporter TauE/SafE family protein [Patescibacteria group bacterium]